MALCGDGRGGKELQQITLLEKLRRIDFAADVSLTFHRRTDQIAAIQNEFGIQWRQACRYLKAARDRILKTSQKSKEQHLANALDFYESVVRNPVYPIKDRLRARQLLDRAVGVGVGAYLASDATEPLALSDAEQAAVLAQAAAERARRTATPPALEPPAPPPPEPQTG